jgi:hypothetical protein
MPRLHNRDGEAFLFDLAALMPHRPRNAARGAATLLHDTSTLIDDAGMRVIQRRTEAHKEFHASPP